MPWARCLWRREPGDANPDRHIFLKHGTMDTFSSVSASISLLVSAGVFAKNVYCLARDLGLAHRARSWPRSICTRLEAKVVERKAQGAQAFATEVAYAFEANGKTWTGNRLLFGQQTPMTKAKAEEQTRQLLENLPAYAIYNPANPEISTLSARAGVFIPAMWTIGLLILIGLISFALLGPEN